MSALHVRRHSKQESAVTIAAVLHVVELNWAETQPPG